VDVFTLTQRFASETSIHDMNSFKLLVRLFEEQCLIADAGSTEPKAFARPNRDVPSDSLRSLHKLSAESIKSAENYVLAFYESIKHENRVHQL
jgi:hypothetical protein